MTARPPWALLGALLVIVTLVVYGIARWQPFAPGAPVATAGPAGDPRSGDAVFARSCAVCHGAAGAGGGVGPVLTGARLSAADVAAVVASGRGIMPAGVVTGTEAADVAAYVAGISGGEADDPATPSPAADAGGRATFTGARLDGVGVQLDAAAPSNWTVWIDGPATDPLRVAEIAAGEVASDTPSVDGGTTLPGRYDRVLVGTDPDEPALAGSLAPERAKDLLRLIVGVAPDEPSVLGAAEAQVQILREHVGFLAAARDEGNLANVRFHGEHMVNITRGRPLRDVDGNGEASNPGDGVGLIGGPRAYLRTIGLLIGPALTDRDRTAAALATRISREGARSGRAVSVAAARPSIAAIQRADEQLARAWSALAQAARESAVVELATP